MNNQQTIKAAEKAIISIIAKKIPPSASLDLVRMSALVESAYIFFASYKEAVDKIHIEEEDFKSAMGLFPESKKQLAFAAAKRTVEGINNKNKQFDRTMSDFLKMLDNVRGGNRETLDKMQDVILGLDILKTK